MNYSQADKQYMKRALQLASEVKGTTFPNPAVGAVVVQCGEIVGEGATEPCGGAHAETIALKKAGVKAKGATLYVTLEPCCHFGRTPPCTDFIIASGIKKVFSAVKDPNPQVSGKGISQLKDHGIETSTGLLRHEAARINEDFFWSIVKKSAWITLKLALTLDGRIADWKQDSKWITSAASRDFVQQLRNSHAAIAVGRKTLEKDNPRLTARCKKVTYPARIVFSSTHAIPPQTYFYKNAGQTRSIIVVNSTKKGIEYHKGLEIWNTGTKDSLESLTAFVSIAHQQGLNSIFIEGGQHLASLFLQAKLVNKLYLFYGNKIVGNGLNGIQFPAGLDIEKPITLGDIEYRQFSDDLMLSGTPHYPAIESN
ncbi:bifunctional diaminohydroxyphosphoribosylaminopyrimidine deaminase/5-amino-6-(5-phosphoribosylamino)uracil reductase RibD [Chitinispirillales bacterium ANBcel5]|uniref:bifunctional diaminohydroxyphosphoribosylaminopyrimidine deaminase/5-amino-6-(5-phosphoribosylamino)uracil reductase RibD n=1 Tax=Cellulosispirillum alkaliphilum TaxID=3039283 RepID=UPI002A5048A1|nr:bifunctional diaminohydroxyphosphoribosylaminopyrimidine deaminase/5-amino-6-(5-phosphoribosylamino)uracil reductase RibD [Chitinispirillales bacterium ANBcel5]